MNDYLLSLILGIVEGLTEFLPVSSTAHLRISEALLHISLSDGYWKMYTIVIQLGAILCLPVYFRERITKFLSTFPHGERGDRTALTHPLGLTIVAFVVTAIPAFLLTKIIGKHLESLTIMGTSLLIGGIVMWIVDAVNAKYEAAGPSAPGSRIHTWRMEDMSLPQAVWIGACQILSAVFSTRAEMLIDQQEKVEISLVLMSSEGKRLEQEIERLNALVHQRRTDVSAQERSLEDMRGRRSDIELEHEKTIQRIERFEEDPVGP